MEGADLNINKTLSVLDGEIKTIISNKEISDSIVNKLSETFKELPIYKELLGGIDILENKNNALKKELESVKKNNSDLIEKVKVLEIEKKTILEQLNIWRSNTSQILGANVDILNKIIPIDNKMAEEYKKGETEKKPEEKKIIDEEDREKRIDADGNIVLSIEKDKKRGLHTLADIKE